MLEKPAPSLAERTTLRLGGHALMELCPENEEDILGLSSRVRQLGARPYPIGSGSNLLADDGELPVILISMKKYSGIEIINQDKDKIDLKARAGVRLPALLRYCLQHGLSGLEGLVGIPGNIGGAVAMNAGSFGDSIGAALKSLEIYDGNSIRRIDREEIAPNYRRMRIDRHADLPLVIAAIFTLTSRTKSVIFEVMNHNLFMKKSRQPITAWTAGCTFKNPENHPPAGILLEQAGMKGRKIGGMSFSAMHSNFLINEGNGCARAAHELIALAREAVQHTHGICLEPEVRFLSCH